MNDNTWRPMSEDLPVGKTIEIWIKKVNKHVIADVTEDGFSTYDSDAATALALDRKVDVYRVVDENYCL